MATYVLHNTSSDTVSFKDIYDEDYVLVQQTGGTYELSPNTAAALGKFIRVSLVNAGGGVGTESDPTVTSVLYDVNGAAIYKNTSPFVFHGQRISA